MYPALVAGPHRLALGGRPRLMAIINVTPDSFSGDGLGGNVEGALEKALRAISDGAGILDVGGESTRPGAAQVDAATELARVVPILTELSGRVQVPVSIDTYKASVAERALRLGATIVNDISGGARDPDILRVAAAHGAAMVLTDLRPQADPAVDILPSARDQLMAKIDFALKAGIRGECIVLDPGIGFGKTLEQNLELIARIDELRALGYPVLLGASRKSFIGKLLGREPADRLPATLVAHLLGALRGADILRVHDVAAHADALEVAQAIDQARSRAAGATRG